MIKRIVSIMISIIMITAIFPSVVLAQNEDIKDDTYTLALKSSGKVLNVYAETVKKADKNGTNVTVWTRTGHVTQQFTTKALGEGKYRIYALGGRRVLDVLRNDSKADRPIEIGGNVQLWASDDQAAQTWNITYRGDGYYSIGLAAVSGTAIGCISSNNNGGNVVLQKYTGSDNQLWQIKDGRGNIVLPNSGSTENLTGALSFSWPIPAKNSSKFITSNFGYRNYAGFQFHDGIDIGAPIGTKVIAAQSGTVLVASGTWDYSAGKTIIIKHDNGFTTRYSHLSEIYVKKSEKVSRDQLIGKSGNTGNVQSHLHFSIYQGNTYNIHTAIPPIAHYWAANRYDGRGKIISNREATTDNPVFSLQEDAFVSNSKFIRYTNPNFVDLAK